MHLSTSQRGPVPLTHQMYLYWTVSLATGGHGSLLKENGFHISTVILLRPATLPIQIKADHIKDEPLFKPIRIISDLTEGCRKSNVGLAPITDINIEIFKARQWIALGPYIMTEGHIRTSS